MENTRPILEEPLDNSGHFKKPSNFTAEDEVKWGKIRMDTARLASYQDSHCGFHSNTFDQTGAYLCRGCNKLASNGECLIRAKVIAKPNLSSCGYWEVKNAGDPEVRYCPSGKLDDKRIAFGTTENPLGFSCARCEYGQGILSKPDSEGRIRWCKLKGHPVEDLACCADNEPIEEKGLLDTLTSKSDS